MPTFRQARVHHVKDVRDGLQEIEVRFRGRPSLSSKAYVLTQLTGRVRRRDRVVLNVTAVDDLDLDGGDWHFVHWNLSNSQWSGLSGGHIMKLRYTSMQLDVASAEERLLRRYDKPVDDVPPDEALERVLEGTPVVACSVHSQVPCVVAAVKGARPEARIVYVMTDGAALPMAMCNLVASMREKELIVGTITAGHAFGGELEAVNVASALAMARRQWDADVIIVALGPGVVGTRTRLGNTALEVAANLDTAAALGGRPVLALRVSNAKDEDRAPHIGLCHHSATILELVRSRVSVAADENLPAQDRHDVVVVEPPDVPELLAGFGLRVKKMRWTPETDPGFFAAAGAAGALAAVLLGS